MQSIQIHPGSPELRWAINDFVKECKSSVNGEWPPGELSQHAMVTGRWRRSTTQSRDVVIVTWVKDGDHVTTPREWIVGDLHH